MVRVRNGKGIMPLFFWLWVWLMPLGGQADNTMRCSIKQPELGMTLSMLLTRYHIATDALVGLSRAEYGILRERTGGYPYRLCLDRKKTRLLKAQVPLGETLMAQIDLVEDRYRFILSTLQTRQHYRFYRLAYHHGGLHSIDANRSLPAGFQQTLRRFFSGVLDLRQLHPDDQIVLLTRYKTWRGYPLNRAQIVVAALLRGRYYHLFFGDAQGYGYVETATKDRFVRRSASSAPGRYRFGSPLRRLRLSSPFSLRRYHPILHTYRPHHGIDLAAPIGTPVYAIASGEVRFCGRAGGYGKVVRIKHADGYASLYAHLHRMVVTSHQRVKQGELIGYVGNSGMSTGAHLHLGIAHYRRWIDPWPLIAHRTTSSRYRYVTLTETKRYKEMILYAIKHGRFGD